MSENNFAVRFLYGTKLGQQMLRFALNSHADRLIVKFLWSPLSKPLINFYIKKYDICMDEFKGQSFRTFRDFFVRKRSRIQADTDPAHLISPCDGWLSAFPIHEDSSFFIKGSHYCLSDLLQDKELSEKFHGGDCLIFRLCSSDYHHYCYIDDGYQGANHYIEGELHSVQPMACETYPVFTINRRMWTLLDTDHFGPVVQTAIGAFVVGGIVYENENTRFSKAEEMGYFELAGSTIVMLFEKNRISLSPHIAEYLSKDKEFRVKQGMWIGNQVQ